MSARPNRIVLASGNAGKLKEMAVLLQRLDIEVVAQSELGVEDADETGTTFAENSLQKARHAAEATGLPAIADDSGLSVDALHGAPGVYSARYSGVDATDERNNLKLLAALKGTAMSDRGAAFHCVATFVHPDGSPPLVARGEWRGSILTAPQGAAGFGYDPLFLDVASGKSSAELTAEQKNARSHRGKALRQLLELIEKHYP